MVVINANEKTGETPCSPRRRGGAGVPGQDIMISAEPGPAHWARRGVATALAGPCAITMLVADRESLVRTRPR